MSQHNTQPLQDARMPTPIIWGILAVCAAPFLLNLAGIDFGSQRTPFPWSDASTMAPHQRVEGMFQSLSGSFSHTILEWSAFLTAMFTAFLAFMHFSIKRDVTTPIIGVALLCAGLMDAFHTLAADRLIEAVADNRNLIPFTWAICRVFNALIMIVGVMIVLNGSVRQAKGDIRLVLSISAIFGLLAYVIIDYCATSASLPQTMYPDSLITRPYDVLPLILFVVGALTVFRRFNREQPGLFAHALLLSMIPETVVEIHMAFGSTALFDNHFNIAHFLKIVAYFVPFLGLTLDYLRTYQQVEKEVAIRKQAEAQVREREENLAITLNSIGDGVMATDTMGRITRMNPMAELLTGFSFTEAQGRPLNEIFHIINEVTREPTVNPMDQVLSQEKTVGLANHTILIDQAGHEHPIADSAAPIRDQGGTLTGAVLVFRDMTEERKAQEALSRIAAIVESSDDAIFGMTPDCLIQTWNKGAERLYGYSAAEVIGHPISHLAPPERVLEGPEILHKIHRGEVISNFETEQIRKDGTLAQVSLTISPIKEAGGQVIGISTIARDITARKKEEVEREALNKQLIDTSRRVGMADVATGVLHNVGNVLNSINVSVGLVQKTIRSSPMEKISRTAAMISQHSQDLGSYLTQDPKGQQIPEYLTKVGAHLIQEQSTVLKELESLVENIDHIKEIINVQQTVASSGGLHEPTDLAALMEQALQVNLVSLERHHAAVVREYAQLPLIVVDKHLVLQVLVNLISNAKHAMKAPSDRPHHLTLRIQRSDTKDGVVHLQVSDDGAGIKPEHLTSIFTQGFTTKEGGHGFGLHSGALSAKVMGGSLTVHSDGEDQGATFTLELPAKTVEVPA